jgi:hypothetical protein
MSYPKLRQSALVLALAVGASAGTAVLSVPASADSKPATSALPASAHGLGLDSLGDLAAEALFRLGSVGPDEGYVAEREALADGIAARIGIDPLQMRYAWAAADLDHQKALLGGLSQLGVHYRRNTSKPGVGFDCSGLTAYAWGVAGFTLTHQSGVQIKAAAGRTPETAQPGDLVYYPGHVMMWLGVGRAVLHAPYPGRNVEVKIQGGTRSLRWGDPTG